MMIRCATRAPAIRMTRCDSATFAAVCRHVPVNPRRNDFSTRQQHWRDSDILSQCDERRTRNACDVRVGRIRKNPRKSPIQDKASTFTHLSVSSSAKILDDPLQAQSQYASPQHSATPFHKLPHGARCPNLADTYTHSTL